MDRAVAWEVMLFGLAFIIVIIRSRHIVIARPEGPWQSRLSPSYALSFVLILFLIFPTPSFAYVFPSDIEDDWPPADQSFFLYIHTDHLGSTNLLTEGQNKSTHNGIRFVAGEVVQRVEYMPFGKERYVLNPALKGAGPKFTGQTQDEEDGLYFYKSRYYDPVLGRFIQPDGLILTDASNPQTLNSYSYVLNNPLKYTDPTGHFVDPPENSETDRESIDASIAEIDRALGKLDKEISDLGGFLEGDGTVGDRFGFDGLDRDMDGDYDVVDRVFENEISRQPMFDFGLDGTDDKFNVGWQIARAFGSVALAETAQLGLEVAAFGVPLMATGPAGFFAGGSIVLIGLSMTAISSLMITEIWHVTNLKVFGPMP